jgi:hypothetical protein
MGKRLIRVDLLGKRVFLVRRGKSYPLEPYFHSIIRRRGL